MLRQITRSWQNSSHRGCKFIPAQDAATVFSWFAPHSSKYCIYSLQTGLRNVGPFKYPNSQRYHPPQCHELVLREHGMHCHCHCLILGKILRIKFRTRVVIWKAWKWRLNFPSQGGKNKFQSSEEKLSVILEINRNHSTFFSKISKIMFQFFFNKSSCVIHHFYFFLPKNTTILQKLG